MTVDWSQRDYPGGYYPVQFDPEKFWLPLGWLDWWGPRSCCFCPCFPVFHCVGGRCNPCLLSKVDITDPAIWKPTLEIPTSCPNEMIGVWWLQDNVAAETVVVFNDALWTKADDESGNVWDFKHDLPQSWTRDYSVFGYILGAVNTWKGVQEKGINSSWSTYVKIRFNFDLGKARLNDTEWVYRIDEDEWQKPSYKDKPGTAEAEDIVYMYRWRRIVRGDGSTTPAFEEMKKIVTSPYPHRNCLEPWCCCWPCCIGKKERLEDMARSNRTQLIIWRPEQRKPICQDCWSLTCTCPCMCPVAAKVDGAYAQDTELQAPAQQAMAPLVPQ